MTHPIVVNEDSIRAYSPAHHTGTSNRRIISAATVGAKQMEVLIGTIAPREGARAHAHPFLEQASYILTGEGIALMGCEHQTVRAGSWNFSPRGAPHLLTVTSQGPYRTIVMYAPPYNENPAQTVTDVAFDPATAPACMDVARDAPIFAPVGYLAAHARPLINGALQGARYMEVFDLQIDAGGGKPDDCASLAEQTVHVQAGQLRGEVNDQAFSAVAGDWVFVPAGARWTMQACGPGTVQALLLRAADFERDDAARLAAYGRSG